MGPGGGVLHPPAPPSATASPSAKAETADNPLTLAGPDFLRVQYILQVLSHALFVVVPPPPAADIGLLELRGIAHRVPSRVLGPLIRSRAGGIGAGGAKVGSRQ